MYQKSDPNRAEIEWQQLFDTLHKSLEKVCKTVQKQDDEIQSNYTEIANLKDEKEALTLKSENHQEMIQRLVDMNDSQQEKLQQQIKL